MVLYSMGKEGAMILTPHFSSHAENPEVRVKDTTGAGDAIIGAYLYCLAKIISLFRSWQPARRNRCRNG